MLVTEPLTSSKNTERLILLPPFKKVDTFFDCLGYTRLPSSDSWNLKPEGAYLYYTDNETVNGLEFKNIPEVGQ